MRRIHFILPAIAAIALGATSADAQRIRPSYSSVPPPETETKKAAPPAAASGPVIDELVIKPGEKRSIVLMPGEDAATMAHLVEGSPTPRNTVTVSLTVKGSVSTLKIMNASGGKVGFKIEGDPSGSGKWAKAGEVAGLGDQQTSNTDYPVALTAIRLTGFEYTRQK